MSFGASGAIIAVSKNAIEIQNMSNIAIYAGHKKEFMGIAFVDIGINGFSIFQFLRKDMESFFAERAFFADLFHGGEDRSAGFFI